MADSFTVSGPLIQSTNPPLFTNISRRRLATGAADGYKNEQDDRLVAFIKELWMRRNYGGKFSRTVHSIARDPVAYGPGWNSNVFATGGVTRAKDYWNQFL